jgi:hypothetical protein
MEEVRRDRPRRSEGMMGMDDWMMFAGGTARLRTQVLRGQ